RNGRLAAAAPLVLRDSNQPLHPLRLEFLGGGDLKEPNRFIASDPASLGLLASYIAAERTYPIRLSRLPNDRKLLNQLFSQFKKYGWITKTASMPYPYLNLELTNGLLKRSLREDLSRGRRRAVSRGDLSVELVETDSSDLLRVRLNDAFQIESSGWKGRNKT